jgi:hypothetical protein
MSEGAQGHLPANQVAIRDRQTFELRMNWFPAADASEFERRRPSEKNGALIKDPRLHRVQLLHVPASLDDMGNRSELKAETFGRRGNE